MAEVVWLASYPKSGNTWARALLEGYFGEGVVEIDHLGRSLPSGRLRALDDLLGVDVRLLRPDEVDRYRPAAARLLAADMAALDSDVGPAIEKIHAANVVTASGPAFPPGAGRAVYIARNPLDVAASMAPYFAWPLDQAIATMADDAYRLNDHGARFHHLTSEPVGSWSGHVRSWLDAPGVPVHLVRYEDLLADTPAMFAAMLRSIGTEPDPGRLAEAVEAARFDKLQAQEAAAGFREHPRMATAPFFRKGTSGSWRAELSPAQAQCVVADHREVMVRLGYADAVAEVDAL